MSHSLKALALTLLLFGCATPGSVGTASRPGEDSRFVVTVVNGTIEPTKPTGEPWGPPGRGDLLLLKLLVEGVSYVLDVPAAGKFAEQLMGTSDPTPRSPNPFVRLSYRGRVVSTNALARTTVPAWEYPMVLDLADPEEPVTV